MRYSKFVLMIKSTSRARQVSLNSEWTSRGALLMGKRCREAFSLSPTFLPFLHYPPFQEVCLVFVHQTSMRPEVPKLTCVHLYKGFLAAFECQHQLTDSIMWKNTEYVCTILILLSYVFHCSICQALYTFQLVPLFARQTISLNSC